MTDNTQPETGSLGPDSEPVETPAKRKGNPFKPGHPRYGGRKKGSLNKRTRQAQEMAVQMGADPLEFLMRIMTQESYEVPMIDKATGKPVLDLDGKPIMLYEKIPLEMKMDAAKNVAPYVHARLQATQVTGADDGPVQVQLPTAEILANQKISDAMQDLALFMAQQPDEADEQHVN